MRMNYFENEFGNKLIFLDGATGSNLAKRGMPAGVCPEKWILENENVLISLQQEYIQAGSDIVYAPTFGANRIKLGEYGLEEFVVDFNRRLVELSIRAVAGTALVAGDITMTGKQLAPIGTLLFEELIDVYKEQVKALYEAGCDLIVVETMMSLQETRAAVLACKEVCDLPIIATLSFEANKRTLFGSDAKTAAAVLEGLGVDAIGANCSSGPEQMKFIIEEMYHTVSIPIIAKPNAGLPSLNEFGETVYNMDAKTFAEEMESIIKAGARIVGGCCGTSPEYIKQLKEAYSDYKTLPIEQNSLRMVTSERVICNIEDNAPFLIIGERINPTGKKKLQEEIRSGKFEMVSRFATEQEEAGANILDINMGMSGIEEDATFQRALQEVQAVSNLPISIDSSDCNVIEHALRIYPGKALVNSVSMETGKAKRLFPLIKKYGAMFILLPLSDKGLPKDIDEKKEIIDSLVKEAASYGLGKERIIVDGLVTTVSANPTAAMETLETIRYCKQQGLATTCGLSNISFGLPERSNVNTAFLTAAISQGLTMAIANPLQNDLIHAIYATDLLMNKKGADLRYIEKMTENETDNVLIQTGNSSKKQEEIKCAKDKLFMAVMKGNTESIKKITETALIENENDAAHLLNQVLLPAINEVGELFNRGKYFLPQLIASANAMQEAISYLEPFLSQNRSMNELPVIVIASVKGDIHDIGKNLVALMLKNYGYKVIDLGKDVPKEQIIESALENDASIIALSALMTTTMTEMKNVIEYAKTKGITAKIIIGGAVITSDYAKEIQADGYSKDAADAIKLVGSLLEK